MLRPTGCSQKDTCQHQWSNLWVVFFSCFFVFVQPSLFAGFSISNSQTRTDNQFFLVTFFYASHNLCIDIERLADSDYFFGMLRWQVNFQTVAHIEYLVHFFPICAALFFDGLERGNRGTGCLFTRTWSTKCRILVCAPPEQWTIPWISGRSASNNFFTTGAAMCEWVINQLCLHPADCPPLCLSVSGFRCKTNSSGTALS